MCFKRNRVKYTISPAIKATGILVSISWLYACGDSSPVLLSDEGSDQTDIPSLHTQHQHASAANRFTTSGGSVWPPQPRNATNVQSISTGTSSSFSSTSAAKRVVMERATVDALDNPGVVASLGDHYEDFAGSTGTTKNGESRTTLEFYNYTNNEAIQIAIASDSSIQIETAAASQYQPPESKSEKAAAIVIAANALRADGYEDLDQYHGTAMLAYPPVAEVAVTGHQFYHERMLYVTFGAGNGELPSYRALVNLNTETAVSRGPIQ